MKMPAPPFSWSRIAILCLLPALLHAYPPAPATQYYGEVRDSFGNQISSPDAWVLFVVENAVIARVQLRGGVRIRENYRALLPLDMGEGSPYTSDALPPGVTFTIEAEIAGIRYPAYGIVSDSLLNPEPGASQRLDFTIGEDSDGDKIPDLWELWQLESSGIYEGDERYSLESIGEGDHDNDGLSDYDEYIAGVFSFLFIETLNMSAKTVSADGWIQFELIQAQGQSYQMEATSDLTTWEPIEVTLDGDRETSLSSWSAEDTSIRDIEVKLTSGGPKFYRVRRIE